VLTQRAGHAAAAAGVEEGAEPAPRHARRRVRGGHQRGVAHHARCAAHARRYLPGRAGETAQARRGRARHRTVGPPAPMSQRGISVSEAGPRSEPHCDRGSQRGSCRYLGHVWMSSPFVEYQPCPTCMQAPPFWGMKPAAHPIRHVALSTAPCLVSHHTRLPAAATSTTSTAVATTTVVGDASEVGV
jgi:hypothetical protein